MGAQPENTTQLHNCLAFTSGSDQINLVVLSNEDSVQRNKMLEAVLNLASLRQSSRLLYLAVPRLLGASIDAAIFRPYGIGLLLYDDRRIDEAVRPQPVEPQQSAAPPTTIESSLSAELASLKTMYADMERTVAELKESLKTQHQDFVDRLPQTSDPSPRRLIHAERIFTQEETSGSELPSFFANNPWLDVLSRRGRQENEPIAG